MRKRRAKRYVAFCAIIPVISAPRYIRLIKSPRLIGVHPYIRIGIIKFTGAINYPPLLLPGNCAPFAE